MAPSTKQVRQTEESHGCLLAHSAQIKQCKRRRVCFACFANYVPRGAQKCVDHFSRQQRTKKKAKLCPPMFPFPLFSYIEFLLTSRKPRVKTLIWLIFLISLVSVFLFLISLVSVFCGERNPNEGNFCSERLNKKLFTHE